MTGILAGLLIAYLGLVGIVFLAQRSLMYHPGGNHGEPSAYGVPEMRRIDAQSTDGLTIESWYVEARDYLPTLIFFQGNAGAIADRGDKVRPFIDRGYGVLLVGYRGYGGNPGSPTEAGLYADATAALTFLEAQEIGQENWVLYGESLGTGVAVEMAINWARRDSAVGAVVLEAPFTTMGDAAASHYPYLPARHLVRDKYSSISKIRNILAPLLIFHGDRDRVIPQKLGKKLFDAAAEPKQSLWISGAGHNDLFDFGAADHVIRFIDGKIQ